MLISESTLNAGEPTVNRKSGRQISAAIQTCLDLFYVTRNPLISLTKTLDTLGKIGWQPADIDRVERIICKVLPVQADNWSARKAA